MLDEFAEIARNNEKLSQQFEALPEVVVVGVVGANGPGASKTPPEDGWSLHLTLAAWRVVGGPVNDTRLFVTKRLGESELESLQASISSESIITFRGKVCESSPFGDPRALLVTMLEPLPDPELEAFLVEFKKPVELADPVLGTLVLDRSVDWFEGTISWKGRPIRLAVTLAEDGTPDAALETARQLWENMSAWSEKVAAYAVEELLPLKNGGWLDEHERPLSAEEFIGRMELDTVTAYPGGEFEFWHNDGDLFSGHSIQISGSLADGPTHADIPG